MKIDEDGNVNRIPSEMNRLKCPFCNCIFTFLETDIDVVTEGIPYDKGFKGFFKINKYYIYHKYVTCPWCKAKLKLRYII
jgi:hypothetical protein